MRFYLALFIVIFFPFFACVSEEKITIGISLPLTGSAATYGTDIKNGLLFANEELGQSRYRFIIEDDECQGRQAASIAQKFAHVDKVPYALGFACSGVTLSAAPIYNKSEIIIISAGASAPEVSNTGEFIFRTFPNDLYASELLFNYIAQQHNIFGTLTEEADYPQGMTNSLLAQNSDGKLQIHSENFLPGTTDFRTTLLRLRSLNIEGLFINPQSESELIAIVRQLRELNWNIPLYGNYYPSSPAFLSAVGQLAEGMIFSDLPLLDSFLSESGHEIYQRFLAQYGPPNSGDFYFLTAYASFFALHKAINSGENVREYLLKTTFDSPIGTFSFDENGDVVGIQQILKVIRNGEPAALQN